MSLIYNITVAACVQMKASFRQLTASTCCISSFYKGTIISKDVLILYIQRPHYIQ